MTDLTVPALPSTHTDAGVCIRMLAFPENCFRWLLATISCSINPLTLIAISQDLRKVALSCRSAIVFSSSVLPLKRRFVKYLFRLGEFTMSCTNSTEVEELTAPMALQPGFSFAVAFESLHSRLALELRKKCTQMMVTKSGESEALLMQELPEGKGVPVTSNERYLSLYEHISEVQREVQLWKANMGEMLCSFERRKHEEFARLQEESEKQVMLAQHQGEQQVECVNKLHAAKVHELFDLFMQVQQPQPITEEFLASIQTQRNLRLQDVVETQQQQIQDLHTSNFLSHLKEQSLQEETARLKLALMEKEDILASLKSEVDTLIPNLHGYIEAREHLLTMTLQEKSRQEFQKLELLLRNEQRENAWMQRALKENKRKRADRLSRLQQQVADLTATLAVKDDIIAMLERGFRLSNLKDAFPQWQREPTIC